MTLQIDKKFLEWAISKDEKQFVRDLDEEIQRRSHPMETQTEFLDRLDARRTYGLAIDRTQDRVKSVESLCTALKRIKPEIRISCGAQPWERWEPGKRVAIVMGVRYANLPSVSIVPQRAVGARDSEAVAHLTKLLYKKFHLECELDFHNFPSSMPETEAQAELSRIEDNPRVGMVVVIGSPVVNPIANVLAAEICGRHNKSMPVKFRWGHARHDFLSHSSTKGQSEEGIASREKHGLFFRRWTDNEIAADTSGRQRYPDCGLMMFDASVTPFRVLLAGHGGAGTVAATLGLGMEGLIDELLDGPRTDGSYFGPNCFTAVFGAEKLAHRPFERDDLELDHRSVKLCWPLLSA